MTGELSTRQAALPRGELERELQILRAIEARRMQDAALAAAKGDADSAARQKRTAKARQRRKAARAARRRNR